jgi:hypothetical protein
MTGTTQAPAESCGDFGRRVGRDRRLKVMPPCYTVAEEPPGVIFKQVPYRIEGL